MTDTEHKQVRVLVNRKSGLLWSFDLMQTVFAKHWDNKPGIELTYQFCQNAVDGQAKAKRAVDDGIDILIVIGGDGTVSTTGRALIDTDTALGVIPMGSGNGFARHFGIPLTAEKAIESLADADVRRIDVGSVNNQPFLVTSSMAWDAALVRSFEKSPVRGIIPYIVAGAYEYLVEYTPAEIVATLDSGEEIVIPDPLVFTIANVTQFGGGAVIAPHAEADDGKLELIMARNQDTRLILANIVRLFDGTIQKMPGLEFRQFKSLIVKRPEPTPIQIDGELVDAPREVEVKVLPKCLSVLVPRDTDVPLAPYA